MKSVVKEAARRHGFQDHQKHTEWLSTKSNFIGAAATSALQSLVQPGQPGLERWFISKHGEHLQLNGRLWKLVASVHALRYRVARRKAGGKVETFANDPRFCHLLTARIANINHKDPIEPLQTVI